MRASVSTFSYPFCFPAARRLAPQPAPRRAAFALLRKPGRLRDAAQQLTRPLKGVGPAMASLMLACCDGSRAAYMSDAALLAVLGTREYSEAELVALSAALVAKAQALGPPWTAQRCQRALWAVATLEPGASAAPPAAAAAAAAAAAPKAVPKAVPKAAPNAAPKAATLAGAKRGREPAAAAAAAEPGDAGEGAAANLGGRKRAPA